MNTDTKIKRYDVTKPGTKPLFETWIKDRGGVIVWENHDLSNPSAGNQFTPARAPDGSENHQPPHWAYFKAEVVTNLTRFRFAKAEKEVDRFNVAVKRGDGLRFNCTAASSKKIRERAAKHGENAFYRFDYETQECVICVTEWEE